MVQLESILDVNKDISQESTNNETVNNKAQGREEVKQTKIRDFNAEESDMTTSDINHNNLNLMSPSQLTKIPLTASTPNSQSVNTSIYNDKHVLDNNDKFKPKNSIYLEGEKEMKSYENSTRSLDEDNTENIDASELKKESIPQVDQSMAIWRNQDVNVDTCSPPSIDYDQGLSDFSPMTLDTRPINFKSLVTPNKLERLQYQLKKKNKIKIFALEEVIKVINEADSNKLNVREFNNSLFDNLSNKINTITTSIHDNSNERNINMNNCYANEISNLIEANKKLKAELIDTQKELKSLKK